MNRFVTFTLALALAACQPGTDIPEIQQLGKTKAEIDDCLKRVQAIDMAAFQVMYDAVQKERKFMNRYNQDSLPQQEAIFLGNYFRFMKRPMARILTGHEHMLDNLEKTSSQLSDLSDAISRGDLDETEWKAHLSTEQGHVSVDLTRGNEMASDFAAITDRYDKEHEQIVAYVQVHRENAKNQ